MSRHHRLGLRLKAGGRFVVPAGPAHHLGRVLRARLGDRFVALSEDGARWQVEVCGTRPLAVRVIGPAPAVSAADPRGALEVWCPLLKGGRTDGLVRQLTELGATHIVPWVGERSVVRPRPDKISRQRQRWEAIAAEATEQCGRLEVPTIAAVRGLPARGPGVFLWEEEGPATSDVMAASAPPERILVGPEGGLSGAEAAALIALGWRPAWLGPRVLRAETAVVVATTLALHALGEGGY